VKTHKIVVRRVVTTVTVVEVETKELADALLQAKVDATVVPDDQWKPHQVTYWVESAENFTGGRT
jgi:nicotinate-nucleotide pyrophosphorylase